MCIHNAKVAFSRADPSFSTFWTSNGQPLHPGHESLATSLITFREFSSSTKSFVMGKLGVLSISWSQKYMLIPNRGSKNITPQKFYVNLLIYSIVQSKNILLLYSTRTIGVLPFITLRKPIKWFFPKVQICTKLLWCLHFWIGICIAHFQWYPFSERKMGKRQINTKFWLTEPSLL